MAGAKRVYEEDEFLCDYIHGHVLDMRLLVGGYFKLYDASIISIGKLAEVLDIDLYEMRRVLKHRAQNYAH